MKTLSSLFMSTVLLAFAAVAQNHISVTQDGKPNSGNGLQATSDLENDERDALEYKQIVIQRAEMWELRRKLDMDSQ